MTGFSHVGHVADVILSPLLAIGGFPVIGGLQTVSAQLFAFLGAQSVFGADKVLFENSIENLISRFIDILGL